jgi:hypothetical protein
MEEDISATTINVRFIVFGSADNQEGTENGRSFSGLSQRLFELH